MVLEGTIRDLDSPENRFPGRFDVRRCLFVTAEGERIPAVVKRMPASRWDRLLGPSRAERCLRTAEWLRTAGVATPEPLAVERGEGESAYVCRQLPEAVQVRAWFRHRYETSVAAPPSPHGFDEVVEALGRLARAMHDGGVFFRDFTDGNILVTTGDSGPVLWLVDLDRARRSKGPLGIVRRLRDLSRPGLNAPSDQRALLRAYGASPLALWLFGVSALRLKTRVWDTFKRAVRPWRW
ncbi:MAG: hypothetical protein DIJKHBIC_00187 [Thermoanaerobaculia bacterium]|nr:hypothetical protein [Thermoanaerobaculia bacterium]